MEKIVISIGGSVILSDIADESYFSDFSAYFQNLKNQYKIYFIVGGGKTARTYIQLGRKLGLKEKVLDEIGIKITRINAMLLSRIIKTSNVEIPYTTDEAKKNSKPIVIMGGTNPGHSTDMVGAELAEKIGADKFIIATNVDGIFDKDPNKFNDAKQIKEITINELIKKYGIKWNTAGSNVVIDGPALEIIKRAKIQTYVVNGKNLVELKKVINNQSFNGTIIKK
jgi:uridylate kinase